MDTNQIINDVVAEFSKLAQIPRPSGHEKAVSDFLYKEFSEVGCHVVQDEVFNIIADLPATPGMENAPLVIIQGHMDMVCVASDGVDYNPLTDSIKLLQKDGFLFADGTSLGGDDGIAIAEALYLFKNLKKHGPLRAIITVDEERGMTGAENLDAKYLQDASYLINCDSEEDGVITVGCAGGVNIDFNKNISYERNSNNGYKITIQGLKGGHSGVEIHKGRANAIKLMAILLNQIIEAGYTLQIAELNGGKARNAIPDSAEAIISTDAGISELDSVTEKIKAYYTDSYGGIDGEVIITTSRINGVANVLSQKDTKSIIDLLLSIHTGVFGMSQIVPSLVETSANIGIIATKNGLISLQYYPRSSNSSKLTEIMMMAKANASANGFNISIGEPSPGWKENGNSTLANTLCSIYKQQNNKEMSIATIHAGLECGWFAIKNPKLDIVSIGVNTFDIHSPKERLELSSIAVQIKLIEAAISQLQNSGI